MQVHEKKLLLQNLIREGVVWVSASHVSWSSLLSMNLSNFDGTKQEPKDNDVE